MAGFTPLNPAPLYQKTDHWFQRATAALLGEVPCRLGCTSCCIGPFPITLLDIHTLQQGLAALPPDHRHRIEQRAIEQTAAMETAFPQLTHTDLLDNWSDQDDRPVGYRISPPSLSSAGGRRTLWRLPSPPPGLPINGHPDRRSRSGPGRLRSPNLHSDLAAPLYIPGGRTSLSAGRSRLLGCASSDHRINRRRSIPALRVLSEPQITNMRLRTGSRYRKSVWSVRSVWSIWSGLMQPNKPIDQMNQMNMNVQLDRG